LAPSNIYKYPGIIRDQNTCVYQSNWQAYECHGLNHSNLIIESMDNDTEHRRLSPVAIISDNGYLDLINGPGSKRKFQFRNQYKNLRTEIIK
jgi:hypothetical protein